LQSVQCTRVGLAVRGEEHYRSLRASVNRRGRFQASQRNRELHNCWMIQLTLRSVLVNVLRSVDAPSVDRKDYRSLDLSWVAMKNYSSKMEETDFTFRRSSFVPKTEK
jgi:hypothetical protein